MALLRAKDALQLLFIQLRGFGRVAFGATLHLRDRYSLLIEGDAEDITSVGAKQLADPSGELGCNCDCHNVGYTVGCIGRDSTPADDPERVSEENLRDLTLVIGENA